jgi:hypothetical protein
METPTPNYRKLFFKSPHHAWFGLLTLGLGFISGVPLLLVAGITAYILGWIYLPDLAFFRRWVDRRAEAARQAAAQVQIAEFIRQRDAALAALSPTRRERYGTLAEVCRDIERATAESQDGSSEQLTVDTRLRKLDELMWMYLRLLTLEQSLEVYLEKERREELPHQIQQTDAEIKALTAEIAAMQRDGQKLTLDAKQRLLNSRQELLETLQKRLLRCEQTKANLAVVCSEQERLIEQIKLIRADAVATRNTQALSTRINASMEHLDETNKWLSELSEFKDLVGEMPTTDQRLGYVPTAPLPSGTAQPPPLRTADKARRNP